MKHTHDVATQRLNTCIHSTGIMFLQRQRPREVQIPATSWEQLEQDQQDDIRFAAHEARATIQFLAYDL